METENMKCIKNALTKLGVKGKVKVMGEGYQRYKVFVNDKYFGIFDVDKNTFVD